jgi:Isocitrate lyase family
MASFLQQEEEAYRAEVAQVKKWWTDSRWRYTRRPFTAEQIVAKRGNLKIEYPSNVQSKKLWKLLEQRFQVGLLPILNWVPSRRISADAALRLGRIRKQVSRMGVWTR